MNKFSLLTILFLSVFCYTALPSYAEDAVAQQVEKVTGKDQGSAQRRQAIDSLGIEQISEQRRQRNPQIVHRHGRHRVAVGESLGHAIVGKCA